MLYLLGNCPMPKTLIMSKLSFFFFLGRIVMHPLLLDIYHTQLNPVNRCVNEITLKDSGSFVLLVTNLCEAPTLLHWIKNTIQTISPVMIVLLYSALRIHTMNTMQKFTVISIIRPDLLFLVPVVICPF